MDFKSNDELDSWLEEGLSEYYRVEPRPGIEQRTLAYVRSKEQRRARFGWKWLLVPAAAVAALVVAAIILRTPAAEPNNVAKARVTVPGVVAAKVPVVKSEEMPRVSARPHRLRLQPVATVAPVLAAAPQPRLATFPAPSPLSPDERMLLTLARRAPTTLAEVAREQGPISPLVVEQIKIPALEDKNPLGGSK